MKFAHTLRNYDKKNLGKDILAGLIIMAVSIPISMGYAQIAGLPAVYGLYGSVFPILIFALFSTSPQFIFGVDAAPAALIGSALAGLNITAGSTEALVAVPMLTFFVALWLLIFSLLKAGKLVNYISAPVMGGFITGICTTIILMQVPKLMGGTAGVGEFLELAEHIAETAKTISVPSVILGVIALQKAGGNTVFPVNKCIFHHNGIMRNIPHTTVLIFAESSCCFHLPYGPVYLKISFRGLCNRFHGSEDYHIAG